MMQIRAVTSTVLPTKFPNVRPTNWWAPAAGGATVPQTSTAKNPSRTTPTHPPCSRTDLSLVQFTAKVQKATQATRGSKGSSTRPILNGQYRQS